MRTWLALAWIPLALLASLELSRAARADPAPAEAGAQGKSRLGDDLREAIDAALLAPPVDAPRLARSAGDLFEIGGAKAWVSPWSFEAGLAASAARGNTDTVDVLLDGKVMYERNKVVASLKIAYVYGEADGERTAENWHNQARMERKLRGKSFLFGKYNYDRDPFANLDYRHTGLAGYGRKLIDRERTKLSAELGAGMSWEQRVGMRPSANPSAYLGVDYAHEWPDGKTFSLEYDFVPYLNDFDLSYMTWDLRFGTPVCEGLDLTIGVRVGWVFEPPPPTDPVDLLFSVGLRATF